MNVCLGGFVKSNIITLEKTTVTQTDEFLESFQMGLWGFTSNLVNCLTTSNPKKLQIFGFLNGPFLGEKREWGPV